MEGEKGIVAFYRQGRIAAANFLFKKLQHVPTKYTVLNF